MKLGKFILHYNTPELTEKLCKVIPDAIVIDNGSDDDKRYTGSNRYVYIKNGLGFTKGWNYCVKLFFNAYDYFWLMNSDIEISEVDVLHIENLIKEGYDMFTPSFNSWMPFLNNKKSNSVREVRFIEFTAPVISKKTFETIGIFDEIFERGYGVEFDFCHRAHVAGLKMWVDDITSFKHIGQQTINKHEGINTYSKKANKELIDGLQLKYGDTWREVIFADTDLKSPY